MAVEYRIVGQWAQIVVVYVLGQIVRVAITEGHATREIEKQIRFAVRSSERAIRQIDCRERESIAPSRSDACVLEGKAAQLIRVVR